MSQADVTTVTAFEGLYKRTYNDELIKAVPLDCPLQQDAPFVKKCGESFQVPVLLQRGHGYTFLAPAAGKTSLNSPVSPKTDKASVTAYQIFYKGWIDYEAVANAGDKERAFIEGPGFVIKNELDSLRHITEVAMWFGQHTTGIGTIAGSGTKYLTITAGTFAPGVWLGMEDANVSVYDGNTARGDLVVAGVDIDNRKITFTTNPVPTMIAGKTLWIKGMKNGATNNCAPGLLAQLASTTGTIFGVNRSLYSLMQPTQINVGGTFSFTAMASGVTKAVAKGLDGDAVLYCSIDQAQNLINAEVSKQVYNDPTSNGVMTVGARDIQFLIAGIKVTLRPTSMCPNGYAALVKRKAMKRVGGWDIKEGGPISTNLFQQDDTYNFYSFTFYTNQSLFIDQPAKTALFSGITS